MVDEAQSSVNQTLKQPPKPDQMPIRGAIRTIIENSTDSIVAGSEFSVFVKIQNPFEIPLTLRQISTHIPTELLDLDQGARTVSLHELKQQLSELQETGRAIGIPISPDSTVMPGKPKWGIKSVRFSLPFMDLEYSPRSYIGPAIARDIGSETAVSSAKLKVPFLGSTEIKRTLKREKDESKKEAMKNQIESEMSKYQEAIQTLQTDQPVLRELQPGNSTTRVFTLRTRKTIWFKPSTYRLQIEIEYEIGGVKNIDTIEHQVQVKASLPSVVIGSFFGAVGGWVVKEGGAGLLTTHAALRLLVSVVLAAMAVILFARKKDVQPLIAVEDLWGGVAIGFLAAYIGPAIIENLIPGSDVSTTPAVVPNKAPG